MKKIIACVLVVTCNFFIACNTATPEDYFETAVLNVNMIADFGDSGLQRELESPSAKLVEGTKDQTEPMKRKEVIDNKVEYIESSYEEIKKLKQTDETKNMVQASIIYMSMYCRCIRMNMHNLQNYMMIMHPQNKSMPLNKLFMISIFQSLVSYMIT